MDDGGLSARLSAYDASQWAQTLSPGEELERSHGLKIERLPGALACRCAAAPIPFFHKAFLNPRPPLADAATLDAIAAFYGEMAYKVVWTPTCGEAVAAELVVRGFAYEVPYAVLARPLGDEAPPAGEDPPELAVREVTPEEADLADAVAAAGFAGPPPWPFDALRASFWRRAPAAYHCYLATWQGEPAAVGTLLLLDGVAGLYGGATLPAFRGRASSRL